MKSYSVNRYHILLSKYKKYKSRLDKAIATGRFKEYRRYKQYQLVRRIRKIQRQLQELASSLRLAGMGAAMGLALAAASPATAQNALDVQQVNATDDVHSEPDVAMDADGDYVVVWLQNTEIWAQRFDETGTKQGSEISVAATTSISGRPRVAIDDVGNFAVTWQEGSAPSSTIHAARFDADGTVATNPYQIAITSGGWNPSIAMDDDGDLVIAYTTLRYIPNFGNYNAPGFTQRTKAGGPGVSGYASYQYWTMGTSADRVDVAMDADGDFVIVFKAYDLYGSGDYYLRAAKIRPNGTKLIESTVQFNSGTPNFYIYGNNNTGTNPAVSMDDNGNFAVSFKDTYYDKNVTILFNNAGAPQGLGAVYSMDNDFDGVDVAMDADGDHVMVFESDDYVAFIRNNYNDFIAYYDGYDYDTKNPSVASDDAGDFVVVWLDNSQIYSQLFVLNAPLVDGGTKDIATTSINETYSETAMDDDGNYVVVWYDDDSYYLYGEIFYASGNTQVPKFTIDNYAYPRFDVAMDKNGNFVVAWEDYGDDEVFMQRFQADGNPIAPGNTSYTRIYNAIDPSLSMDSDGDYAVAFIYTAQPVYRIGVRFSSNYISYFADNYVINQNPSQPSIALDETGHAEVVWQRYRTGVYNPYSGNFDATTYDIEMRRMNSGGTVLPQLLVVSGDHEQQHKFPAVGIDENGNFAVSWLETGSSNRIWAKRFDNAQAQQGGIFNVQYPGYTLAAPDITMDPDGNFSITTQSLESADPYEHNLRFHRFDNGGGLIESFVFGTADNTYDNFKRASINSNDKGDFVVSWTDWALGNADIKAKSILNSLTPRTPTDITLSAENVDENQPDNTIIGDLTTADLNSGDSHIYSFTTQNGGGTDNGSFAIVSGNRLQTQSTFNYETKSALIPVCENGPYENM